LKDLALFHGRILNGKRAKRVIELFVKEYFPECQDSLAIDYKSNLISRSELRIGKEGCLVR
jgi:hypothetical protein